MPSRAEATIDQSWYLPPPPGMKQRTSAGGIVVRRDAGEVVIALGREGDYLAPVLPKGRIDPGETIEQAARREIHEEIGIAELELVAALGTTERFVFDKTAWVTTHFFLYRTSQVAGVPTDDAHHRHGPIWRRLDDLADMFWPDQRDLVTRHRELILRGT
jgi:8-oxo-dGTP pyrophosphatase MutT (NUDIX family)